MENLSLRSIIQKLNSFEIQVSIKFILRLMWRFSDCSSHELVKGLYVRWKMTWISLKRITLDVPVLAL